MVGAAVVIFLVGLVVPIALLLGALFVDGLVVAWALFHVWHDELRPRVTRSFKHAQLHWHKSHAGVR